MLEAFGKESSFKENLEKSLTMFSLNVQEDRKNDVKQVLTFKEAASFRRYLGFPWVNWTKTKDNQLTFLTEIQTKMSSWKSKNLCMVSRVLLVKSMLQTIPITIYKLHHFLSKLLIKWRKWWGIFFGWQSPYTRRGCQPQIFINMKN